MSPSLYMNPLSPPSRAVLMTADALGIDLNLIKLDLSKGAHREPDYTTLNPLHSVPTLVLEDGNCIIDSHAINAYLVGKYGQSDQLYPKDNILKRAKIDQMLHFDTGVLFQLFRNTAAPIFYRKSKEVAPDQIDRVLEGYGFLEKFLQNHAWISGDELSIADFSLIPTATSLSVFVPIDKQKYPNLIAWIEKFKILRQSQINDQGLDELIRVVEICRQQ